eukprot:11195767-Lingulodinium_polyedra.AAC.1
MLGSLVERPPLLDFALLLGFPMVCELLGDLLKRLPLRGTALFRASATGGPGAVRALVALAAGLHVAFDRS